MSAQAMYQDAIKTLAASAVGHGTLASPDGRLFLDNPLCGDCIEMQVAVSHGAIADLAHQVRGCLLCRASAAVIGKRAVGASIDDVERLCASVESLLRQQTPPPAGWDELAVFAPVHDHPSRYGCVLLPFQALLGALRAAGGPV